MSNKVRDTLGKFVPKSEVPRKVRSVNLTDAAWQWLATIADKAGMSRNDYLEALAAEDSNPFMETAIPQTTPFMEAAIHDLETDAAEMAHQPDSEVLPLIETVQPENQRLHIELGNSASEKELLKQELVELRSQLETERADQEEIKKSTPIAIGVDFPDVATILSQLRAKRLMYRFLNQSLIMTKILLEQFKLKKRKNELKIGSNRDMNI